MAYLRHALCFRASRPYREEMDCTLDNLEFFACAGLRMAPGCAQMTRTWIVYNKPKVASYTHAGMIMGLGLTSEWFSPAFTHCSDIRQTAAYGCMA